MAKADRAHFLKQWPDLHLGQSRLAVFRHDFPDLALKPRYIQITAVKRARHYQRDIAEKNNVFFPQRHQQQQEMFAHIGINGTDHPEIEHVDAILPPHEITRVRIGVKEAVHDDLFV